MIENNFIMFLIVASCVVAVVPFISALGVLIFFTIKILRNRKNESVLNKSEIKIIDNIIKTDGFFDGISFKEYAMNCIKYANDALINMDIDKLRLYETNELFYIHKNKINLANQLGSLECFKYIMIGKFNIIDYKTENEKETISCKAFVQTQRIKIDVSNKTMKNIDPNGIFHTMRYEFVKINDLNKNIDNNKCPNCGAILNENFIGKCPYCNSVINNQNEWKLNISEEYILDLNYKK